MPISRNLIIDWARQRKWPVKLNEPRRDHHEVLEQFADDNPGPAGTLANHDLGQRIDQAVNQLPAEQKEVFLMRTRMDLPFKEIADIQGVSINTALARMQYALSKLRPLLQDDYDELARADPG